MKKIIFSTFLLCFLLLDDVYSKDDYPSDYIYGFVQGCYETIEQDVKWKILARSCKSNLRMYDGHYSGRNTV